MSSWENPKREEFDIHDLANTNWVELLENDEFIDLVVSALETLVESDIFVEVLPGIIDKHLLPKLELGEAFDDTDLFKDILDKFGEGAQGSKELVDEMITKREENLQLKVIPEDADKGDIITVNIKMERFYESTEQWVEISEANKSYDKLSGEEIKYELSKTNYSDFDIKKLRVTITGNDSAGAEAKPIKTIFNIEDPVDPPHDYNLTHGLFDDYSFENPNEGNAIRKDVKLVGGTYGTFAAQYKYRDSADTVTIDVNSSIKSINNVIAYKRDGNKLIKVTTIGQSINGNKIELRINDSNVSKGDTILIKYSGLMPNYIGNETKLISTATIGNASSNATITIVEQPDLY